MENFYTFLGLLAVLMVKPLIWTPLLFLLDRLAALAGPRFRARVSGHYAGRSLRYFYSAQSLRPTAREKAPPLLR